MGRTTKLTDDVLATLCECVGLGMTYEQSAEVAGVSDRVVRLWRAQKSSVFSAIKKAELNGMRRRLKRIDQAGEQGTWVADMTWLERRFPDQWGKRERVDVNHTGNVDVRVAVRQLQSVLDEVLPDDPDVRRRIAQKVIALDGGEDLVAS